MGVGSLDEGRDFETMFRSEYPRLVRALFLLTGDPQDAEEIAQEALVRTYERWGRVGRMSSPVGYVYRVALNLNRRRVRRLGREARRWMARPVPGADPAAVAEASADVRRALRALAPAQREALVLGDWLGLGPAEMGAILGIEPGAARVRLRRAREAFRRLLGEGYE
ncbi:MAG TPA: sigma-70 family RNA polymerase sigma factor [Actinomycetota bacterium]|nr:sigma-70 family RNA polymerase sigma factor [Actinomycetota bacterium]